MKKLALSLIAILALSACTDPSSGSGTLTDGTPVIADRVDHVGTHIEDVKFTSVDGWSCAARIDRREVFGGVRSSGIVPVACTDGAKGRMTIALATNRLDHLQPGDIHYTFILDNGKKGSFRI